jgi:hypothetical protein
MVDFLFGVGEGTEVNDSSKYILRKAGFTNFPSLRYKG